MDKEELLNYIDKSVNTLKDNIKEYVDKYIEDQRAIEEEKLKNDFYKKYFESNSVFNIKHALYSINPNEIKLGDIVFGVVYGDDIEDERYPFKVIEKDNSKFVLQGIKNTDTVYTFEQACKLRWNIKLMVNQRIILKKDCTIISKELIDKYNLDLFYLKEGFTYWTSTPYLTGAWVMDSDGIFTNHKSNMSKALPLVIVDLC